VRVVLTDGGRAEAGFKGKLDAGDCVTRAIAIATERPYRQVYDELAELSWQHGSPRRSARDGVTKEVTRLFLARLGWAWTPTMQIGSGCRVHLRDGELPNGRLVVQLSKHVSAVIDGVVHDNHDPSRGGTRCVYGYWTASESG
jgi:hypothetical protein